MDVAEIRNKIWFQGRKTGNKELDYAYVGRGHDHEGPGFYFTDSPEDAQNYALPDGIVISGHIAPRKLASSTEPANAETIRQLILMAPNVQDSLSDWAENPSEALKAAIDGAVRQGIEKDSFQQVWADFYRNAPAEYLKNLVQLGYDGHVPTWTKGVNHFVLYNPECFKSNATMKPKAKSEVVQVPEWGAWAPYPEFNVEDDLKMTEGGAKKIKKPTERDLDDAFAVLKFALGFDSDEDYVGDWPGKDLEKIDKQWKAALKKAKFETWPVQKAAKEFNVADNGRRPKGDSLENPIIVAEVDGMKIVLDGNHRLITKFEQNAETIDVLLVPLPWAEELTGMDGEMLAAFREKRTTCADEAFEMNFIRKADKVSLRDLTWEDLKDYWGLHELAQKVEYPKEIPDDFESQDAKYKAAFEDVKAELLQLKFPIKVYRGVPDGNDHPHRFGEGKHFGLHWSVDPEKTKQFGRNTWEATVTADQVEWLHTIYTRMDEGYRRDEAEITLQDSIPLDIKNVQTNEAKRVTTKIAKSHPLIKAADEYVKSDVFDSTYGDRMLYLLEKEFDETVDVETDDDMNKSKKELLAIYRKVRAMWQKEVVPRGNGIVLWRAITVHSDELQDFLKKVQENSWAKESGHEYLDRFTGAGTAWAWSKKNANIYWSGVYDGHRVLMEATVPIESVNVDDTVVLNMMGNGGGEKEIRLTDGADLTINRVWVDDKEVLKGAFHTVAGPYAWDATPLYGPLVDPEQRIMPKQSMDWPNMKLETDFEDEGFVGKYWGSAGSGILFTCNGKILLLKRANWVEQPGTWGIPGGAIPVDPATGQSMDAWESAEKEATEELGSLPSMRHTDKTVYQDGNFTYTTFIVEVPTEIKPAMNGEHTDYVWAEPDALPKPLHFGVEYVLKNKRTTSAEDEVETEMSENEFIDLVSDVADDLNFDDPGMAYWQCTDFSAGVFQAADMLGLKCEIWSTVIKFKHSIKEVEEGDEIGHTFLKIGNKFCDFTARQGDPESEFPLITGTVPYPKSKRNRVLEKSYRDHGTDNFYLQKIWDAVNEFFGEDDDVDASVKSSKTVDLLHQTINKGPAWNRQKISKPGPQKKVTTSLCATKRNTSPESGKNDTTVRSVLSKNILVWANDKLEAQIQKLDLSDAEKNLIYRFLLDPNDSKWVSEKTGERQHGDGQTDQYKIALNESCYLIVDCNASSPWNATEPDYMLSSLRYVVSGDQPIVISKLKRTTWPQQMTNHELAVHWDDMAYGDWRDEGEPGSDQEIREALDRIENNYTEDTVWMLRTLNVSDIEGHHDGHDKSEEFVKEYAEIKTDFPPIIVEPDEDRPGKYKTIDGQHRLGAAKLRGDQTIRAYVPDLEADAVESKKVYHGSPNDFESFDLEMSGSTQGNARGWGVYFSEDKKAASFYTFRKGHLYQADIPSDKELLDWDKPLTAQPKMHEILKTSTPYLDSDARAKAQPGRFLSGEQLKGGELYGGWGRYSGLEEKEVSQKLKELGIPGMTYLTDKIRNYVIWDTSKIKNLRKVTDKKTESRSNEWQNLGVKLSHKISTIDDAARDGYSYMYVYADLNGKRIGSVEISITGDSPSTRDGIPHKKFMGVPHGTEVEPEYRRMGIAAAMYDYAVKNSPYQPFELHPDEEQSDAAKKLWNGKRKWEVDAEHTTAGKNYGDLYHMTSVGQIWQLGEDNFEFYSYRPTAKDTPYAGRKHVSLTRNSRLQFNAGYSDEDRQDFDSNARIVIDGSKLSNKYQVFPYADLEVTKEDRFKGKHEARGLNPEFEEVVLMPEGKEKLDMRPFIKRVDIYDDPKIPNYNAKYIPRAIKELERLGIPYQMVDKFYHRNAKPPKEEVAASNVTAELQFKTMPAIWNGKTAINRGVTIGPKAYIVPKDLKDFTDRYVNIASEDLKPLMEAATDDDSIPDMFYQQNQDVVYFHDLTFRTFRVTDLLHDTILKVLLARKPIPDKIRVILVSPKRDKEYLVKELLQKGEKLLQSSTDDEETEPDWSHLKSIKDIEPIRGELAKAAQIPYDAWEQDADGMDLELGSGGICHLIVDELLSVLDRHGFVCTSMSLDSEVHVVTVLQVQEGIYILDIPYGIYETGGGYTWRKIPDVVFEGSDITLYRVYSDPDEFKHYSEGAVVEAGLSATLYHATNLQSLKNILKEDRFKLTTAVGTASDDRSRPADHFYFLSTARSPIGHYNLNTGDVQLVLDGTKLNQKYQGGPIDYWGPEARRVDPKRHEMEDRVWSREPFIPNASRFIREIHVYLMDPKIRSNEAWKQWLTEAGNLAIERNIPIYLYTDRSAYQALDERKAVPWESLDLSLKEPVEEFQGRGNYYKKDFDAVVELYEKTKVEDLSKLAADTMYRMGWDRKEFISGLMSRIHNEKNNPESGVQGIVNILRREKLKSITELADFLFKKWHGTKSSVTSSQGITIYDDMDLPPEVELPMHHVGQDKWPEPESEDDAAWEEDEYNYRLNTADSIWYAVADGVVIGHLGLKDDAVETVYVDPDWQGKGVAVALYEEAVKMMDEIVSDPRSQEPGGRAIWEKLKKLYPDRVELNRNRFAFYSEPQDFDDEEE